MRGVCTEFLTQFVHCITFIKNSWARTSRAANGAIFQGRPHKIFAALRDLRAWVDHVADCCDDLADLYDKFRAVADLALTRDECEQPLAMCCKNQRPHGIMRAFDRIPPRNLRQSNKKGPLAGAFAFRPRALDSVL